MRIEFSLLLVVRSSSATALEIRRLEGSSNITRIRSLSSPYISNPYTRLNIRVDLLTTSLVRMGYSI